MLCPRKQLTPRISARKLVPVFTPKKKGGKKKEKKESPFEWYYMTGRPKQRAYGNTLIGAPRNKQSKVHVIYAGEIVKSTFCLSRLLFRDPVGRNDTYAGWPAIPVGNAILGFILQQSEERIQANHPAELKHNAASPSSSTYVGTPASTSSWITRNPDCRPREGPLHGSHSSIAGRIHPGRGEGAWFFSAVFRFALFARCADAGRHWSSGVHVAASRTCMSISAGRVIPGTRGLIKASRLDYRTSPWRILGRINF